VSALTKVFIVLQVFLAVLLVAGMIVFVNRTEDWRAQAKTVSDQLAQANVEKNDLRETNSAVTARFNSELSSKNADLSHAQERLQDLQTQLDSTKTTLATAQADLDKATNSGEFSAQAQKVALDQLGTLQGQYSDLQKTLTTLQKENADNGMAIADLHSRLDATQREREYLAEQNSQLEDTVDKDGKLLQQNHINLNPTAAAAVTPEPSVPLVGEVEATTTIDGVPYGTINIGSADQVASGMRFSIVDPNSGTFLGYLKVDQVEPHAASGRIDGPHVNDVQKGNQVRTQL
jgi:peptidoglycan hydrolase CwlO-like protein